MVLKNGTQLVIMKQEDIDKLFSWIYNNGKIQGEEINQIYEEWIKKKRRIEQKRR